MEAPCQLGDRAGRSSARRRCESWHGRPPPCAQSGASASIVGRVTDASEAVLPGVTVAASSAALQVRQATSVTDQKGEYRLVELPLGAYEVTYTLQGFQTVKRENVRLTAGFIAKLDVVMGLASVSESIT